MRKKFTFFLLSVLLLSSLIVLTKPITAEERRSITIRAPAVALSGGVKRGVLTNITITIVKPGKGRVFISTMPLSQVDMQASAHIAAMVACDLAGVPLSSYDFLVEVRSNTIVMGGPSASAYICVAMYALIKGLSLRRDVAMTGMINPDGSIGPVGGILEKAEAVAKGGAKVFLIPVGEEEVTTYKLKVKEVGPFVFKELRPIRVNVLKYAAEKLGLKIVPVYDIRQAITYFTGVTFAPPPCVSITLSQTYVGSLRRIGEALLSLDKRLYRKLSSKLSGYLASGLEEEASLIKESEELLGKGKYYVACSVAFSLLTHLKCLELISDVRSKGESAFTDRVKALNATLESLYAKFRTIKPTLKNIGLLVALAERIEDLKRALSQSGEYYARYHEEGYWDDFLSALKELAYAEARAYGLRLWMKYLELKGDEKIPLSALKRSAESLMSEAQSVMAYALSIFGEESVGEFKEVSGYLDTAKDAYLKGDYLMASATSLRGLAYLIYKFSTLVANEEALEKMANYSRSQALSLCLEAERLGVQPYLPLNYVEYGDYVKSVDDKLFMYKLASMHAKYLVMIVKEVRSS